MSRLSHEIVSTLKAQYKQALSERRIQDARLVYDNIVKAVFTRDLKLESEEGYRRLSFVKKRPRRRNRRRTGYYDGSMSPGLKRFHYLDEFSDCQPDGFKVDVDREGTQAHSYLRMFKEAIIGEHLSLIKALVSCGMSVDQMFYVGPMAQPDTPLILAMRYGADESAKLLLELGASPSFGMGNHKPAIEAIKCGNNKGLNILCKSSFDPAVVDNNHPSLLSAAVSYKRPRSFKMLMDMGCNAVDALDSAGNTPLMIAGVMVMLARLNVC